MPPHKAKVRKRTVSRSGSYFRDGFYEHIQACSVGGIFVGYLQTITTKDGDYTLTAYNAEGHEVHHEVAPLSSTAISMAISRSTDALTKVSA